MYSFIPRNSEAFTSEFLRKNEHVFPWYASTNYKQNMLISINAYIYTHNLHTHTNSIMFLAHKIRVSFLGITNPHNDICRNGMIA